MRRLSILLFLASSCTSGDTTTAVPQDGSSGPALSEIFTTTAAQTSTSGDWVTRQEGAGLVVTGYNGNETEVIIPSHIDGVPVTAIEGYFDEKRRQGFGIFEGKDVESVVIPDTVTIIGDFAFYQEPGGDFKKLAHVAIPPQVKTIGKYAFNANYLTSIIIPQGVESIGESAFSGNQLAGNLVIPSSVKSIGDGAFCSAADDTQHMNKLTSLTISPGVTSIGSQAFYNNQLSSVSIPDTVTFIGMWAFYENQLHDVRIPPKIQSIERGVFCRNQLTGITIPPGVTSIDSYAFSSNNLKTVHIPKNIASLGEEVFSYNLELAAITVENDNMAYAGVDGVLFSKDLTALLAYPGGKGEQYTIPSSVTVIADSAFLLANIKNVIIPDTVISIGKSAFSSSGLTGIVIPPSVKVIKDFAFTANGLTSITIPDNMTFEGRWHEAFEYGFDGVYTGNGKKGGTYKHVRSGALPEYYTVQNGDSLWSIAGKDEVYNNPYAWSALYKANRMKLPDTENADIILPGMVLEIPGIDGKGREGILLDRGWIWR